MAISQSGYKGLSEYMGLSIYQYERNSKNAKGRLQKKKPV